MVQDKWYHFLAKLRGKLKKKKKETRGKKLYIREDLRGIQNSCNGSWLNEPIIKNVSASWGNLNTDWTYVDIKESLLTF